MKKLAIILFLSSLVISCSDDNQITETPLEGRWLVIDFFNGGDFPSDTPPSSNNTTNNLYYIFSQIHYKIELNNEILNQGTFTYTKQDGSVFITFNNDEDINYHTTYRVDFVDKDTIKLEDSTYSVLTLSRIK